MYGLLWADSTYGLLTFIVLTLILGGLGAWASGRALAQTWRPVPMLALYMVGLAVGVRFLHYALYGEELLSLHFFIVTYLWSLIAGAFGYRQARATQMATQYSWLYERAGLNWRVKGNA